MERGHELEEAAKKGLRAENRRKLGGKPTGLESGRTIKWESHKLEVAMESGERPSWESCKQRKLQTGKAASWADHKAAGPEAGRARKPTRGKILDMRGKIFNMHVLTCMESSSTRMERPSTGVDWPLKDRDLRRSR
jgi:hypothetical protein